MPVRVQWDDELERVVYWEIDAPWSMEEFFEQQQESFEMVQGVPGIIHTIVVIRANVTLPQSAFSGIRVAQRRALETIGDQMGTAVIVSRSPVITSVMSFLMRFVSQADWRIVDTLDEARDILRQQMDSSPTAD